MIRFRTLWQTIISHKKIIPITLIDNLEEEKILKERKNCNPS